jgi:transcriptional regulator with XRE-family HTH domain
MLACDVTDEYLDRMRRALDAAMYYREIDAAGLAARIDVDRSTVHRWLRGDSVLSAAHAAAIATALDAPSDLFLRPPATRGEALAMMGAYDEARGRPAS